MGIEDSPPQCDTPRRCLKPWSIPLGAWEISHDMEPETPQMEVEFAGKRHLEVNVGWIGMVGLSIAMFDWRLIHRMSSTTWKGTST